MVTLENDFITPQEVIALCTRKEKINRENPTYMDWQTWPCLIPRDIFTKNSHQSQIISHRQPIWNRTTKIEYHHTIRKHLILLSTNKTPFIIQK